MAYKGHNLLNRSQHTRSVRELKSKRLNGCFLTDLGEGNIWKMTTTKRRCNHCKKFKVWEGSQLSCQECRDYMKSWQQSKREGKSFRRPPSKKSCAYCEKEFTAKGGKKYCSKSCKQWAADERYQGSKGVDPMTPEEFEEMLDAPDHPWDFLMRSLTPETCPMPSGSFSNPRDIQERPQSDMMF